MPTPTRSASRDNSFMKPMRVASMALAAYLANSALRRSITGTRSWGRAGFQGADILRIRVQAHHVVARFSLSRQSRNQTGNTMAAEPMAR